MHVGGVAVFAPRRPASTTTGWSSWSPPHRPGAALPAEDQAGAGRAGEPGLGRRRRLRRRPTTSAGPRCQPGHRRPAAGARRPAAGHAGSTAPARCGRCTSSRGCTDGRVAVITKTHHAMVDGITAVDIGQVILDASPRPAGAPRTPGARARAEPDQARRRRGRRDRPAPDGRRRHPARSGCPTSAPRSRRSPAWPAGCSPRPAAAARPAPESPLNAEIGEQRRFGMARHRPRRLPGGPQGARRHRQRRGARHRHRGAAGLAADPRRAGHDDDGGARAGAGQRPRRRRGRAPWATACRSYLVDLPVGEPSPVMRLHQVSLRDAGAQGGGPGRRRRRPGQPRRLRTADPARARGAGRGSGSSGGYSTSW